MKNIHRSFIMVLAAAFGGSIFAVSCGQSDRTIQVGQRIHHDDFEYLVTDYRVSKTLGEGNEVVAARGNFFIITFQVENHAKRVNHEWADSIAYIVDKNGMIYENLPWAQQVLRRAGRSSPEKVHLTPPGTIESTVLVFDLPENAATPSLMVRGETLMGDFFDGGQFRKVKIALW